ncbi:hypothetical protein PG995_002422 [Apiospora arundinis]|uniref:Integral membrane protein n=1 Tax=Apiospora arundinis TaxID=335852 RepID=A0ABR2J6C8_9PEZI
MATSDTFTYSFSNFDEPEPLANKKATILAVVIAFMCFSWTCVSTRLWVRFKIIRDPGWDDLCVVMYLLTTTAGSISLLVGTKYGLGQHFLTLSHDDMITWSKTFYVANAAYCTSTAFIKLALLLQYLRVYPRGSLMHRACLATLLLTALWGVVYSFISWFPCFPVNHVWELKPDAKCYGYGSSRPSEFSATYESHTAINMILDVIVLIIPMPLLFKEGTGFAQRLRITALLCMGTIVIALAIWRLQTILEHKAATVPTRDPTWYGPITMLLAVLEVDAAAVCASVPIFWPVLSNKLGGIFVTQEIEIRRETRFFQMDDEESGGGGAVMMTQGHDGISHSRQQSHSRQLSHSRTGSEVELKRHESDSKQPPSYQGSYSMKSMDPLALPPLEEPTLNAHEATIKTTGKKSGWKWL